jgi:hypothetical protein
MEKVQLTIKRADGRAKLKKVVEIEKKETTADTRRSAELLFCNEYINRDCKIAKFENLTEAKKFAKLKIKSKIII